MQTASFLKNILLVGTDPIRGLEDRTVSGGRLNVFKAMTNLQVYCGTTEGDKLDIINLYPNPTAGELTIEFETPDYDPYQLMIFNTLGQLVFEKTITPPRFAIPVITEDVSWLSPGIYTVSLIKDSQQISRRFAINRFGR